MSYVTLQRKALFDILEQHRDEALSVQQLTALLGESVSRSAVYRNLSALEKQGLIKKTASNDSKKLLYRYTGSSECKDHLHLQCFKCGKTYHLKMPATNALINDVMQNANFKVDSSSTVLYGVCEKCRNE